MVATRATRNSNVILHPVTRILIAISAVFLVFKLENGPAYAKGAMNDHAGSAADGSKKYDSFIVHRTALAVQRLYELVDSPAAVAAAAGVLVTIEISKILPPASGEMAQAPHEAATSEVAIDLHLPHNDQPADMQAHPIAYAQELPVGFDTQARMLIVAHQDEPDAPAPSIPWHPPQVWLEAQTTDAVAGSGSTAYAAGTSDLSPGPAKAESDVKSDASAKADHNPPAETTTTDVTALDLVKTVLAQIEATAADAVFAANIYPAEDEAHDTAADASLDADGAVGEISLRDLDHLSTVVGFHYESSAEGGKLMDALVDLIEEFGAVDIEYEASDVLIEQAHIKDAAAHSIGLWVNVMSDGSRISVVGSSDIVDDILGAGLTATS
jgi:hypothetical protein